MMRIDCDEGRGRWREREMERERERWFVALFERYLTSVPTRCLRGLLLPASLF